MQICCKPVPTASEVAVARNEQTPYKTYWAMVIADKTPKKKDRKVAAQEKMRSATRVRQILKTRSRR